MCVVLVRVSIGGVSALERYEGRFAVLSCGSSCLVRHVTAGAWVVLSFFVRRGV